MPESTYCYVCESSHVEECPRSLDESERDTGVIIGLVVATRANQLLGTPLSEPVADAVALATADIVEVLLQAAATTTTTTQILEALDSFLTLEASLG